MSFFIGLDLGQASDYTAVCVIETVSLEKTTENSSYHVRHLQRYPLGTAYPVIVSDIGRMLTTLPGSRLVVDNTGVGRPVVDLFRAARLDPVAITITGGDKAMFNGGSWHVPKRDLVGALSVAFQTGALKIASSLPEAKTLVDELLNFKVKINVKTAHDSYEAWREGVHDDLVLAVALALWWIIRQGQSGPRVSGVTRRW